MLSPKAVPVPQKALHWHPSLPHVCLGGGLGRWGGKNEGLLGMPCPRKGTEVGMGWRGYWALPLVAGLVSNLGRCFLSCTVHK